MSHVLGAAGACAYVCLVRAFILAPAAFVSLFHYTKLPWATVLGFFRFRDFRGANTAAGSELMVAGGPCMVHQERRARWRCRGGSPFRPARPPEALREGDRAVTRIWDALGSGEVDAALVGKTPAGATAGAPAAEAPAVRVAPRCLLPGSFNPVHEGHRRMLALAAARLGAAGGAYELAILNPDKPSLSPGDAAARLAGFSDAEAVWLTRAPTFPEKARIFPGAAFAVGVDTLVRIAEPRYYGGSDGLAARSPSSAAAASSCSDDEPRPGSRPWSRQPCPRRSGHFATACRRPTFAPTCRPPRSAGPGPTGAGPHRSHPGEVPQSAEPAMRGGRRRLRAFSR